MDIYTIYKATNKINGKIYIGFDSNWPSRRRDHISTSLNIGSINAHNYFHRAIRYHKPENFIWEIIYQSKDKDYTLNTMETYFITEYNTFNSIKGYNSTLGGEGCWGMRHSAESRKKISDNHYDCSGLANPAADLTIYTWQHDIFGEYIGTRCGLLETFPESKLHRPGLRCLILGTYKQHKGWKLIKIHTDTVAERIKPKYIKPKINYPHLYIQVACPYCNKIGAKASMYRWHFDKCKLKEGGTEPQPMQVECPHCQKVGQFLAMQRWHFNKCRFIPETVSE